MRKHKKSTAFILVLLLVLTLPFLPGSITDDSQTNVYAAAGEANIDLAQVTTNVTIKSSGGSIWVNTRSALNADFRKIGDLSGSKVILSGKLASTTSSIIVESDVNNSSLPINILMNNASVENNAASTMAAPRSAFKIIDSTVNMELVQGTNNYITVSALYGAGIELTEKSNLTITGPGFLSSVMSHAGSYGAAIGGGFSSGSSIQTGEIMIGGEAEIYAKIYRGAGIGGGYMPTPNSLITTGRIQIEDSTIDVDCRYGAAIGGGGVGGNNSSITTNTISISDSDVNAAMYRGACIGGGFTIENNSDLNIGPISITSSDIKLKMENIGASIGGGYAHERYSPIDLQSIKIQSSAIDINMHLNGAAIGGGYTNGDYSSMNSGDIDINSSTVIATVLRGAVIGGGYTYYKYSPISTGDITINDSDVSGSTVNGTVIGGGRTFDEYSPINTGKIGITNSKVVALTEYGAGIGGGFTSNYSYNPITTDAIRISGSIIDVLVDYGAGIGGGYVMHSTSNLALGKIILEGDFITAYSGSGNDIGAGNIAGQINRADGVYISGGSVHAKSDSIYPEPLSGSGEPAYKVTVPYQENIKGQTITVDLGTRTYEAKIVSDEKEHGASLPAIVGAYIYLPEGTYDDIEIGDKMTGKVKVVSNASVTDNIVELFKIFPFTDVPTTFWGRSAVEYVYSYDLMNGVTATLFKPNEPMLRSMFTAVVGRMDGNSDGPASTKFSDVREDAYFASHVKWGTDNDIIKGVSDTKFAPNNRITREQVATIIVRYAEYLNIPLTTSGFVPYDDFGQVSEYAKDSVMKAQVAGIMTGKPGNKFAPKANISRAEAAQMLKNFRENVL